MEEIDLAGEVSDVVQITKEWAPVATTVVVVVIGPLFIWMTKRSDERRRVRQELAAEERKDAQELKLAVIAKQVETATVTAGVAANRAGSAVKIIEKAVAGQEARTEMLAGIVAKVEDVAIVVAEVKKTTAEIHVLSDGTMSLALATGLEAAQGRADAVPTAENKEKLAAAQKKFDEHEAKMKVVEANNAAIPEKPVDGAAT